MHTGYAYVKFLINFQFLSIHYIRKTSKKPHGYGSFGRPKTSLSTFAYRYDLTHATWTRFVRVTSRDEHHEVIDMDLCIV